MITKSLNKMVLTNDTVIRNALRDRLVKQHAHDPKLRIIDEFNVNHGSSRIDMAVVNGVLHGYEIKSDRDSLYRLPEQMQAYNEVFEQVTIVVGKIHVLEVIKLIPDWWGLTIAKVTSDDEVIFAEIRGAKENPQRQTLSMARLLWRSEALEILEEIGMAKGVRSKPRSSIYAKLSEELDQNSLGARVREAIFLRLDWRSDPLLA